MSNLPTLALTELTANLATYTVLDVREAPELVAQPFPHPSIHIPLAQLPNLFTQLPQNKPIAVLCRSGGRSAQATQFLLAQGYDAHNLTGGILAFTPA